MAARWKKWLKRIALWVVLPFALLVLFAHPFFAITDLSGGKVLVVEGWMPREGLKEAAALFSQNNYDRILVTGTVRPFTYYLQAGDVIEVRFAEPVHGKLDLGTAGLPDAEWSVMADGMPLLQGGGGDVVKRDTIHLHFVRSLLISAGSASPPADGAPVIYIGGATFDGKDLHSLTSDITIRRGNGAVEDARPSYAHEGALVLREAGIPADRIQVVPTFRIEASRTLSTAHDFIAVANMNGITRFDVATLGVHARRTRGMYRNAKGSDEGIGIIALNDPKCTRWGWWSNATGWYRMMKEII
ncbi:MAG TPA: hypothetical protein PK760_06210, partial [Flavobacteriales bacterium]|nr:hypothetical protein [Flavobacteriales bacterium]